MQLRGAAKSECFLTRTRLFSLAESLVEAESLIGHPATMTHASIPTEARAAPGVDDGPVWDGTCDPLAMSVDTS